ncbi:MAG TPA: hypothetical protein VET85_14150 [Stellaceae bacterium]|nr:hypothetical protein [Stellaceae bacterium]
MTAAAPAACPETGQSAQDLVLEASRHVAAGANAAALAALAKAAAADPNHLPLHFITALMAWRSGDFARALGVTRACLEREPMNGTIAEVLASLYAQVGNLQESLYHGKLATALKPDAFMQQLVPADFPSFDKTFLAIQDRPLFAHAKYCRDNGHIDYALDRARQHIDVAPEDDETRQFYGELLLRFGQASAAVEALQPVAEGKSPAPALSSLYARALTGVGDFESARRWHDKARSAAPRDAAIAAARLFDALWLGDDTTAAAANAAAWAEKFAKPAKPSARREPRDKLVIGYLVSDFHDRGDVTAVAAVARAHNRGGAHVIAYGIGGVTWDENIALSGAFDQWRDISRLDPATFARTLANDGLDIVIDVGGLAAPGNLQALARASSMPRVAWLQNPLGLATIYDAVIAGDAKSGKSVPRAWPVGWGAYPVIREGQTPSERIADQNFRFGADIHLHQLNRATTEQWSALLTAIPRSVLLLRQNDMRAPATIDRLVERFGRELAGRIDIVDATTSDQFYRQIDLAVAPAVGTSPRVVAEALSRGVPALAFEGDGFGRTYAALIRDLGLGDELVATSLQQYVERAKALAASADARQRVAAAVTAAVTSAEKSAADIALGIEQAARSALAKISA